MKKFFGGKKKKGSKATPFLELDPKCHTTPVVSRKLNLVQSTEQLGQKDGNNISDHDFMHSKSQETLTTAPLAKSILTKRLQQQQPPTKSPPALVMPRPRYAEPSTRAVLKSYEHDKTQLDPEHVFQLPHDPLVLEQKDYDLLDSALNHPFLSDPIPFKHISLSPITALSTQSTFDGTMDGTRKINHGYRDSVATSDDAIQAPGSPSSSFDGIIPRMTAPSGEDDIDSKAQHQVQENAVQPDPLHSLQQKLVRLQKQREMDRIEYGQMEQALVERTKWMTAEMDRTQSKILALTHLPSRHLYDPSSPSLQDPYYDSPEDDVYYYPTSNPTDEDDLHWTLPQRHHDRHRVPASRQVHKSKSGDSLPCLSRSSSRTSTTITRSTMDRNQMDRRSYPHPPSHLYAQSSGGRRAVARACHDSPRSPSPDLEEYYYPSLSARQQHWRSRSVERPHSFYHQAPAYGGVEDGYSDEDEPLDFDYPPVRRHPAPRYAYLGTPLPVRPHHRMPENGYWSRPHSVLSHRYSPTYSRRRSSPFEYIM